jgi:hypothetical protein
MSMERPWRSIEPWKSAPSVNGHWTAGPVRQLPRTLGKFLDEKAAPLVIIAVLAHSDSAWHHTIPSADQGTPDSTDAQPDRRD